MIWQNATFAQSKNKQTNEITILFAYTKKTALEIGGGAKTIQEQADYGIKQLNECLTNSKIGYTAVAIPELVEVDLSENIKDEHAELAELRKVNGKYNRVHQIRREKQADIVCLIFAGGKQKDEMMGIADLNGDMMVCHFGIFDGTYIFPHEFGHNLGAEHHPNDKNGGDNDYLIKFRGELYRTVSNNGGVAIPYYAEDRTIEYEFKYQDKNANWKKEKKMVKLGDKNYNSVPGMRIQAKKTAQLGENLPPVKKNPNAYTARLVNASNEPMPEGAKDAFKVVDFTYNPKTKMYTFTYNASLVYANIPRDYQIYLVDKSGKTKPQIVADGGINQGFPDVLKGKLESFPIKSGDKLQLRCCGSDNEKAKVVSEITVK